MPWSWWIFFLFLKSPVIGKKNAGNSSVHCMFLCYCFSKYRYVPHSTLHMTVYCPMYFTLPEKRICGCLLYLKEITNPQVLLKYCKFHIPREPVKYWYTRKWQTREQIAPPSKCWKKIPEPVTQLIALHKAACSKPGAFIDEVNK